MMGVCKKHAEKPAWGYSDCPGCEVERQRERIAKLTTDNAALTAENARVFAMVDARERTIAELTALCDGYRGEVERSKSLVASLREDLRHTEEHAQAALTRARAEGMEDKTDAERWRAVIGCARIRVLGSAGIVERRENGYAHLGLELWTRHPVGSEPEAVEWLAAFADIAAACRLAEQSNKGEEDEYRR